MLGACTLFFCPIEINNFRGECTNTAARNNHWLQGEFLCGKYHGQGSLLVASSGIRYTNSSFANGKPYPEPIRMHVDYPKTIDKKKAEAPPTFTLGALCAADFAFVVQVQGHAEPVRNLSKSCMQYNLPYHQ